jgi:hypothetical protein
LVIPVIQSKTGLVELFNFDSKPFPKTNEGGLIRGWHSGQHLGNGRAQRGNKGQLRLAGNRHIEQQLRQLDPALAGSTGVRRRFGCDRQ